MMENSWNFDMSKAPRDGTLLLLLIDHESLLDHPLDDTEGHSRTVGHNSLDNTGDDEWKFAGWSWSQDYYMEGRGTPVAWQLFPDAARHPQGGEMTKAQTPRVDITPLGDQLHKMIQCSIFGWPEDENSKAHQLLYRIEREAAAEIERLTQLLSERERELQEAREVIESKLDAGIDKIMAMSDEQISALNRAEGHDPNDTAKLTEQAFELAVLKHKLAAAEQRLSELGAQGQWVPKEPTHEMEVMGAEAFYGDALRACPEHTQEIRREEIGAVYKAMLAAAPPSPQTRPPVPPSKRS